MVDKDEEVADGLGTLVGHVRTMFQVRFANQQHDARCDADEERQGYAKAHERCLMQFGTTTFTTSGCI